MLYQRHIPETKQEIFIGFFANSLSLSGIPMNHIQIRTEKSKDPEDRNPWVTSCMSSVDVSWKWVMKRKLIQCNDFLQWFIKLNDNLMRLPCYGEDKYQLEGNELGRFRTSKPGGQESSNVDPEKIQEYMESIFSVLEEADKKHDEYIMPKRIRFNSAVALAHLAWKIQFQIGYICPFYQGNWMSARLLVNTIRCHWSLPWLTYAYEDDNKDDPGRTYFNETDQWIELFDKEGVLTESHISNLPHLSQ